MNKWLHPSTPSARPVSRSAHLVGITLSHLVSISTGTLYMESDINLGDKPGNEDISGGDRI